MFQLILANEELSPDDRELLINVAVQNGRLNLLQFFLPAWVMVFRLNYERAILIACNRGNLEIVRYLLNSMGPARREYIPSAITNAAGPDQEAIRELLRQAPTLPEWAPLNQPVVDRGRLTIALSVVRETPEFVLSHIVENGFPTSVCFIDQAGVDAGGLTKQLVSDLSRALVEKGVLKLDGDCMPVAYENSEGIYRSWGVFLRNLYERNLTQREKLVIGRRVHNGFFDILKATIYGEAFGMSEQKRTESIMRILSKVNPLKKSLFDWFQNPTGENDCGYENTPESLEAFYQDQIAPYKEAAMQVLAGIKGGLLVAVYGMDFTELSEQIQGMPINGEDLATAIIVERDHGQSDADFALLERQAEWIREEIRRGDLKIQKAFLHHISGQEAILTGLTFKIKRSEGAFEVHTCFNLLCVPPIDNKELFISVWKSVLPWEGFDIV